MAENDRATRLALLREQMAAQHLDAFIVQRTDEHNSEYVQPCEERVAWLAGFTGSNALMAITADAAVVLSDGRYTVQLTEELDPTLFERRHIVNEPLSAWLEEQLKPGQVLAYDPKLTKKREREAYTKITERKAARLEAASPNPLDVVWASHNRPDQAKGRVRALDLAYTGEDQVEKRRRIGAILETKQASHLLVTAADDIAWLLNIRGADIPFNPLCLSHLILAQDGSAQWFVEPTKLPNDLDLGDELTIAGPTTFEAALDDLGSDGALVLADPAVVPVAFSDRLQAAGAKIIAETGPIPKAKAVKNAVELEGARRAQARDAIAVARFLAWLKSIPLDGSISEMAAASRLADERAKLELYQGPSFDTISAHGPNAALPHYRVSSASDRPLTGDSIYLVDSGGQFLDGTTDITRTLVLGTPTAEMRQRFTAVLQGHIALSRAVFPKGTTGGQLDTIARQPLWSMGLDFDHGTGHGIGAYLCVHEGPQRIAKVGSTVPFEPRHDPLQRARLLQTGPLRYPNRESHYCRRTPGCRPRRQ